MGVITCKIEFENKIPLKEDIQKWCTTQTGMPVFVREEGKTQMFEGIEVTIYEIGIEKLGSVFVTEMDNVLELEYGMGVLYFAYSLIKALLDAGGKHIDENGKDFEISAEMAQELAELKKFRDYPWYIRLRRKYLMR